MEVIFLSSLGLLVHFLIAQSAQSRSCAADRNITRSWLLPNRQRRQHSMVNDITLSRISSHPITRIVACNVLLILLQLHLILCTNRNAFFISSTRLCNFCHYCIWLLDYSIISPISI